MIIPGIFEKISKVLSSNDNDVLDIYVRGFIENTKI